MKNNKAFTLIELLAVVTILTILSLVITPIIDKNIKKSKEQAFNTQIENIRLAGISYYSDNTLLKPSENSSVTITLSELINLGYIGNVKNPKTGEPFNENVYIKYKNTNGKYEYLVCPFESCE
jgi:prepilin-type N-terminal cleavage/methylation domain-containing protein